MADRLQRHRRLELLTAEEERELAARIDAGRAAEARLTAGEGSPDDRRLAAAADAARERFVEANLRLVHHVANRFRVGPSVDRDDVVQDGMIGLRRAVEKFDGRKGFRFSTYATWWIRQAIQRGLEHHAGTIRIPSHRRGQIQAARAADTDGTGRLPPELARIARLERTDSLDRVVGDGADPLGAFVAAPSAGPAEVVAHRADQAVVGELLGRLDPPTRRAVERRFGLDGGEPATYSTIAEELGVSDEAARRRVVRALEALRPHAGEDAA